jgi:hypothetical protein
MAPFLSVVVPVYNEQAVLGEMYERLTHVLESNRLDMKFS